MNSILNSYDLFLFLKKKNLIDKRYKYWWPTNDDFEVFLGAILTQNTKWINVEKSLENLRKLDSLDLEKLSHIDIDVLISAITPSGFKNQKSIRIKKICQNIIEEFGDFETFKENVCRDWLLSQKGIGAETADAILCYSCHKEQMVVDSYTNRLLKTFGYEFESYDELKAWLEYGINENFDKIESLYDYDVSLNMIYCRFHGKIVEFMKNQKKS
ncbi:MAG: 3-methyladenine DNA glycosylase [Arcobacter sp.]|uniref:3-methyladenine DNA glycosylase n=1 Tax=uncultured Arcobacter sp. TaxID=165434 RepID=UPI000CC2BFF4|nr:3-methyladenine DNA glycosylase [uncultured Arcobacter sp.]PLY09422.1 MAG: 3-methyladenine DNA glycosylase [Arcobacter sp.]